MLEIASQIILCLLVASALGFMLGFLIAKNAYKSSKEIGFKSLKKESEPNKVDLNNLTHIKGIGLKISLQLNELGITNISQIASWKEEDIEWLDKNSPLVKHLRKYKWIEQAKDMIWI